MKSWWLLFSLRGANKLAAHCAYTSSSLGMSLGSAELQNGVRTVCWGGCGCCSASDQRNLIFFLGVFALSVAVHKNVLADLAREGNAPSESRYHEKERGSPNV